MIPAVFECVIWTWKTKIDGLRSSKMMPNRYNAICIWFDRVKQRIIFDDFSVNRSGKSLHCR